MPREMVTLQVGQCGNQIGCRFWDQALREHAAYNQKKQYDDAISSFFKNVDTRHEPAVLLPIQNGKGPIHTLKARAVVVDMEEGVINEMLKSPLGGIFDSRSMLADVSGSGNNWAHGHHVYGPQYRETLLECVRSEVEQCDSLQGFLLLHSMGGGTGSGLGTYLLGALEDAHPEVFRFTVSLFPSPDDDVVTSPYNATLSLRELIEHASCVMPLENQALFDLVSMVDTKTQASSARSTEALLGKEGKPFDRMNNIAANMLLNLTAGMRFAGSLNVDMNDITMNMVPYPRLHFLVPAMSPLLVTRDRAALAAPRRAIDALFSDVMSREYQLMQCNPRGSTCLACGLLLRGDANISDANRNVARIKPSMRMAYWNQEGFKIGLCNQAPLGAPHSLLCLNNTCAITTALASMHERFEKLYKRGVYKHHYTQFMPADDMAEAGDSCMTLLDMYRELDKQPAPHMDQVYKPRGLTFL